MFKKQILVVLVAVLLSGCSRPLFRSYEPKDDNLVESSYEAVELLIKKLRQPLPKGSLVVINSLINVQNLGQNLPFGRIVSDQISSAFQNAGYQVTGMELPTELFAKNDLGILQLPEKTKEGLNILGAKVVVIGSYAPGRNNVYVSLRIVDIPSQTVISSTDYSVSMGPDVKVLSMPPQSEVLK